MAPSAKSPNVRSHAKTAAKARKQKTMQQRSSVDAKKSRVAKQDERRGARAGILPTSGPNRALSKKKARKVERALAHAMRRKEDAEQEDAGADEEMKDQESSKKKKKAAKTDEQNDASVPEVEMDGIA